MKDGTNVWYVLADVDDSDVAASLGLNFSAKMTFMANAERTAKLDQNGDLVFDKGKVDFSPVRSITPGPAGSEFPPTAFQPGAVGDKDYSPFVQIVNAGGVIYNATAGSGSSRAWIDSAIANIERYRAAQLPQPEQAVFQSWDTYPQTALPENAPPGHLYLVQHYRRPRGDAPPSPERK